MAMASNKRVRITISNPTTKNHKFYEIKTSRLYFFLMYFTLMTLFISFFTKSRVVGTIKKT